MTALVRSLVVLGFIVAVALAATVVSLRLAVLLVGVGLALGVIEAWGRRQERA